MSDDYYDDLDPNEQDLLRSLGDSGTYSKKTEDRIVKALRREGLILGPSAPRWMPFAKVGGVVVGLVVAFFLGTQFGGDRGDRTEQIEPSTRPTPESISVPESPPPAESEPLPPDQMLTAFHMDQEHPLAIDAENYESDPFSMLGKTLEK